MRRNILYLTDWLIEMAPEVAVYNVYVAPDELNSTTNIITVSWGYFIFTVTADLSRWDYPVLCFILWPGLCGRVRGHPQIPLWVALSLGSRWSKKGRVELFSSRNMAQSRTLFHSWSQFGQGFFLLCKPAAIILDNRRSEVPTGCGEHPSRRADCPASQCMRPVLLLIYTNRSTGSDTFLQYFHPISCPAYLVNSSVFGMPTSSSRLRKWSPECHPDGLLTTWNGRSSFDMLPSLITNITAL